MLDELVQSMGAHADMIVGVTTVVGSMWAIAKKVHGAFLANLKDHFASKVDLEELSSNVVDLVQTTQNLTAAVEARIDAKIEERIDAVLRRKNRKAAGIKL